MKRKIFFLVILLSVFVSCFYLFKKEKKTIKTVDSFEECIEEGYPILRTYPETCQTPDGRIFEKEVDEIDEELIDKVNSKKDLITVNHPQPYSQVSSPLTVLGKARGYWFFEGDFPIRIEDEKGNLMAKGFASTNEDWMTEDFISFEGRLEFDSLTESGFLVLERDNPSGLEENDDELKIPVKFKKPQMKTINLYYYDPMKDLDDTDNVICSEAGLVAVSREVPISITPVQDAINLLIKGEILPEEKDRGITTEFPLDGLKLKGAKIVDNILTLEFDDPYFKTSGGSCRSGILWLQIEKTAKQFTGIEDVQFQPEDLFQP